MSSRLRPALLAIIAISFILAAFTNVPQRIVTRVEVATALVGTFFLFPHSHIHLVAVDEARARIDATRTGSTSEKDLSIPALIHQVQLGALTMKPTWTVARQSCLDLHPGWEFRLWRDEEANAFVKEHYPELFSTYRGYPLDIQRSNVLRYLVLDYYGGMYLDLDLRCRVPLDGLRNESFLTPPANPTGVNNAFIASTPHHAFWKHLISSLVRYNVGWFGSPYITNMMSTGCHFFSTMHRTFAQQSTLAILDAPNKLNGHVTTPLFEHLGASSWHKGDAKAILRLGKAVEAAKARPVIAIGVVLAGIAAAALALFVLVLSMRRILSARARRDHHRGQYTDLETSKHMVETHRR